MKEILRANYQQANQLAALSQVAVTIRGVKQLLETNSDAVIRVKSLDFEVTVDQKFVDMLTGGENGLYNELAHPIIEKKEKEKTIYFRGTDKKMKKAALTIINEARSAEFKLSPT